MSPTAVTRPDRTTNTSPVGVTSSRRSDRSQRYATVSVLEAGKRGAWADAAEPVPARGSGDQGCAAMAGEHDRELPAAEDAVAPYQA